MEQRRTPAARIGVVPRRDIGHEYRGVHADKMEMWRLFQQAGATLRFSSAAAPSGPGFYKACPSTAESPYM